MDLVKFARPHHIVTVAQSVIGVKDAKLLRRQSKLAEKKAAVAITPGANFDFS